MVVEPILIFFLLRYFRKILRTSPAFPDWDKLFKYAMIGVVVLFIIQKVFSIGAVTVWIWHVVLLLIIALAFEEEELYPARNIMFAVLPMALVSMLTEIVKLLPTDIH